VHVLHLGHAENTVFRDQILGVDFEGQHGDVGSEGEFGEAAVPLGVRTAARTDGGVHGFLILPVGTHLHLGVFVCYPVY